MAEEIFEMRTENGNRNNKRGEVSRKNSGGVAEQGRDMPQETAKGSVPAPPAVPPAKPVPAASSEPSPIACCRRGHGGRGAFSCSHEHCAGKYGIANGSANSTRKTLSRKSFPFGFTEELEKMEERIVSRMKIVVDEVVSTRLKEFAQSFDEDDE